MNDHTFNSWGTFTSPSMHPAPKRRRIGTGSGYDELIPHQREPSKIEDKRVIASQALRCVRKHGDFRQLYATAFLIASANTCSG